MAPSTTKSKHQTPNSQQKFKNLNLSLKKKGRWQSGMFGRKHGNKYSKLTINFSQSNEDLSTTTNVQRFD